MKYFTKKGFILLVSVLLANILIRQQLLVLPFIFDMVEQGNTDNIFMYLILFVVGFIALYIVQYITSITYRKERCKMIHNVRKDILNVLKNISFRNYIQLDTSAVYSKIESVYQYIDSTDYVLSYVSHIIGKSLALIVVFYIDATVGAMIIGVVIIHIILIRVVKPGNEIKEVRKEAIAEFTSSLTMFVNSIKTARLFGRVENILDFVWKKESNMFEKDVDCQNRRDLSNTISATVIDAIYNIIIVYNIYRVLIGEIDIQDVVLMQLYISQAQNVSYDISYLILFMDDVKFYKATVKELLSYEQEIDNSMETINDPDGLAISIKNLSFKYEDSKEDAIKGINIDIPENSTVAIVGESGSGKSTIMNILNRLYDDYSGEIKISNDNYREVSNEYIRNQISIVEQDSFIFNASIRDNISMFDDSISDEDINRVIEQSGLKGVVDKTPEGLETILGEKGVKLSGGERQRIAIARVILANKKIRIFDEATSALDNISEKIVSEAMYNENSTNIIIAHRLSTIEKADKIIVMKDGSIIESGTHQELLDMKGYYYQLSNK